ncbi:MAG: pyruvate kinase, partial [Limisphaerales bacterium]
MATVGPTLEKPEDIKRAIEAGASWFRLPCGYRQRPHLENALAVRKSAKDAGISAQLLLDLPSSRPRTGSMTELRLNPGDRVLFWDPELSTTAPENNGAVAVPLPGLGELMDKLVPQQRMWFCDGRLNFVVDELLDARVMTHMVHGTVPLKSSNSLFLPDSPSPFRAITPLDVKLLRTLSEGGIKPDWVALSLIASPEDVRAARTRVNEVMGEGVKIMAKFETIAALDVAEEIIDTSDGIMVARGDLGLAVCYIRL